MLRKGIATILLLILTFLGTAGEAGVQKLSPHVSIFEGSVNGVFIERDGQCLVIYGDPGGQLKEADKVLFTHSRRDIVWAGRKLVERGAESIVPQGEVDKFNKVDDYWSAFVDKRFHDYNQQGTKILTEPLSVSRAVRGGDTIKWQNISIQVLDTPGYTRGAVSYFLDTDGKRYGFVGDLIYGNGQIMDLYSLQDAVAEAKIGGYHGYAGRIGDLIASLRKVLEQKPDILIPARGPVIEAPESAVKLLIQRLQRAYGKYLSINAGHWYFKDRYDTLASRALGSPSRVDWMPYAAVVRKAPPDWVIPIGNSRLLVSADGSGFLIDCGSNAIIAEIVKLVKSKRVSGLDGVYITHYHDDHTDKIGELVEEFDCPVYSCRELTDILEHPGAYRLPCLTSKPIANLTSLADGHKMRWKEFELTSYYFPGQTIYHGALLAERNDGQKIFFIGDSFTPSGMDDYCLLNRNFLHEGMGYHYCLDILKDMPPDYLLVNQHVVEPFRFDRAQIEHMANVLAKRKEIMAELFPWNEANCGIDERWARIHPYGQKANPGQTVEIVVKVLNHSGSPEVFTVRPNVPEGFGLEPAKMSRNVEPREQSEMPFRVTLPSDVSKNLYVITCDVEFDEWDLHHWCESMVEIRP
ncbi:MAG: MBL fold metallo-hydrolase [Planctomycetota bacterium]|jgi:glyoxylase-like metal-dependent hydrolase (beta-lactamase superfamily II)